MASRTQSFIAAHNFCTGSQSDFSTCIANNMRFTPFLDDTYKASKFAGLTEREAPTAILNGKTYVDIKPVALANITSRIQMANDFGVTSFRCSDIFDLPGLPLPNLRDLGIEAQDIVNVVGVDPTEIDEDSPDVLFEGIALSVDDTILGWLLNGFNLLIGASTAAANSMTTDKEIRGIILNSLDYYALPDLSLDFKEQVRKADAIYAKYLEFRDKVLVYYNANQMAKQTVIMSDSFTQQAIFMLSNIKANLDTDVVDPLSSITPDTDFTTYDYSITQGVADKLDEYNINWYSYLFPMSLVGREYFGSFGIPPRDPIPDIDFATSLTNRLTGSVGNILTEILNQIKRMRDSSSTFDALARAMRVNDTVMTGFFDYAIPLLTLARTYIVDADELALADKLLDVLNSYTLHYSSGYLIDVINALHGTSQEAHEAVSVELDTYSEEIGKAMSINLYNLLDQLKAMNQTSVNTRLQEINLGGNFKDVGRFYFADLAYIVGYGKLTNISSIQIDDELYDLTSIVDDNGDPVVGISESGCTKYSFSRHVLPTYSPMIDMYIYPGTIDQPYCPTINSYHNFFTSKYSGMFTKQDGDAMGLYVFKGYRPMVQSVEEVIQIGKMELNAINLNDPSLDQKSYETMVMKEIKNLTNASSINGSPLSTNDFKYYSTSKVAYPTEAANYPGLAIIEFKNFPLGKSLKAPKIKVLITSEELSL